MILGFESLTEVKLDLVRDLCVSDWLYLDYWGCSAEAFLGGEPPGATSWEDFVLPCFDSNPPKFVEASGRYLMTSANTEAILRTIRKNLAEVTIMGAVEIDRLERWHQFCVKNKEYCVCYQVDF